ncbi:MAG: ABC transporter substrate-binding protein [Bacteroidaceae bacterium]|nr:ABC transporter substrate-binding protein [Bacteroidaceae bacterium]
MRHTAIIPIILLLLASCRGEQVTIDPTEEARRDSLALHVAVLPVMDCLPIYYAQRMGMFREEGLDVRLQEYSALMDADTALIRRRVELAYADVARVLERQGDSLPLRVVAGTNGRLTLLTARKKRIRALKHLSERMIALERLSAADYWSDEIMREAGLEQSAIYRPQVNDVKLRWTMLREQLVDGALLPEPYTTLAKSLGHSPLYTAADSVARWSCLAIRKETARDTMRSRQLKAFFRAYDRSVEVLNGKAGNADTLMQLWTKVYELPREVADSIVLPTFPHAALPEAQDADLAVQWLTKRERRIRKAARDSLFLGGFTGQNETKNGRRDGAKKSNRGRATN